MENRHAPRRPKRSVLPYHGTRPAARNVSETSRQPKNTSNSGERYRSEESLMNNREVKFPLTRPTRVELWPAGTWKSLLLGMQSWLIPWLLLVLLSISAWVPFADLPVLANVGWMDAAQVGNRIYAIAFGAVWNSGSMHFSLVPWGLTFLIMALLVASLRAAKPRSVYVLLWGILSFLIPTWISLAVASTKMTTLPAYLGSLVFTLLVFLLVYRRFPVSIRAVERLKESLPWLIAAVKLLRALLLAALIVSSLTLVWAIVAGWTGMIQTWKVLNPGIVGSVCMIVAALVYLPTALVWSMSWLVGPGFRVGADTIFSQGEIIRLQLPPIPFFSWLPDESVGWAPLAVPVLAALITGIVMSRKHGLRLPDTALAVSVVLALLLLGGFVVIFAVRGSLGAGYLSYTGPQNTVCYAAVLAWGIPYAAVILLAHPRVWQSIRYFSARISGKDITNLPTAKLEL